MLRVVPVTLAIGLAVLWVIGLAEDATSWLTWVVGSLALPELAVTGLLPERTTSAWAAVCLALVGAALAAAGMVGLDTGADPWLAWWTLLFAALTLAAVAPVALQERLDGLRAPPII